MKRLIAVAAAVAVLALAVVTVGGAMTSAQEGDGPIETFLGKVADKLGVSEDELKDAIEEARIEMIDEAVADGRLRPEQGERIKERVKEGGLAFLQGALKERRHGPDPCRRAAKFIVKASAEVLGKTSEELIPELKAGKSLAELAEAQGMDVDDFKAALLDQVRSQLDELVAQGELTQERAGRVFTAVESHIDGIVNAHGRPHGPCPSPSGPHYRHERGGPPEAPGALP